MEASLLLPFLWFVIFMLVCLGLYLHDRSVLSACACEMAGKGAALKYQSSKSLEQWLTDEGRALAQSKLLSLEGVQVEAEVTGKEITVRYQGETGFLGGLKIREEETAKRLDPVAVLRLGRRLGGLRERRTSEGILSKGA